MDTVVLKDLLIMIKRRDAAAIKEALQPLHPADIANLINSAWEKLDQVYLYSLLPEDIAAEVMAELHDEVQDNILESLNNEQIYRLVQAMDTDDAADLLADLEESITQNVLARLRGRDREELRSLLGYAEDTAGGLMQTEIVAVRSAMRRDRIIAYIREFFTEDDKISQIYVVDDYGRLIGQLEVLRLLLNADNKTAWEMMDKKVRAVTANTDQELVADMFRKYDLYSLAVTDDHGRLLGRITVDDIIDVIDEEASEDAYHLAGLETEDRVFSPPWESVRRRLPWLTLNLFTALLVSSVVGLFEDSIAKVSLLAVLMPIVAGLGGNSGTQTLTVITRGLAMGELLPGNAFRAVRKEVTVGVLNGILIGSLGTMVAYLTHHDLRLGLALGLAMICNMFIAALFGSMIPVAMKSLKLDPALASSILITMLTDMCGFASFLGLATLILR